MNALPRRAFDRSQYSPFARRDEQNRVTRAAGSARAADTMDVTLDVVGYVVVDDVRDALDVEPARRDVGRHDTEDAFLTPIGSRYGAGQKTAPLRSQTSDAQLISGLVICSVATTPSPGERLVLAVPLAFS